VEILFDEVFRLLQEARSRRPETGERGVLNSKKEDAQFIRSLTFDGMPSPRIMRNGN
jgi:hypothetical protein